VQANGQSVKTIPELVRDLSTELPTPVHEGMELATAAWTAKEKRIGLGAGAFGATGVRDDRHEGGS
jgi:hypothetical protein